LVEEGGVPDIGSATISSLAEGKQPEAKRFACKAKWFAQALRRATLSATASMRSRRERF
jgi:hypothetical protein